jgi:hypothetical protein
MEKTPMIVFDIFLAWVHILCAVVFLGTMFAGTFAILPTLKAHLEYEQRQKFIVNFIPKVRSIMTVILALLVLSGLIQILRRYFTQVEAPTAAHVSLLACHIIFAAVTGMIFVLAPKILGKKSKEGLCCDPDADDPPLLMGVMTSTGTLLHYAAIAGGWLAVLCAITLTRLG